ncbi:hypothetical protein [Lysobacter sp. cf310]|uniref:hypothetical protein n=1 Tax=Lysobacter sp. cf310 TaxID=1761790 RepID=UPI0008F2DD77|nr:hypothetical protein [Lysobacter sp. cf310]SFL22739.1 hypothetical protein SAMN04487938_3789 [Lysobacter sp. cf310]
MSDGEQVSGTIRLKDLSFAVERAQIVGWLYDDASGEVCWSIDVHGSAQRFGEGEVQQDLRPHFYDEVMPARIDDWRRLEGFAYGVDLERDDAVGDSLPSLYLCSHLSLPRSELRLGARRGARFALQWRGLAEANWDEGYGEGMPFQIDLDIPFAHQEVRYWHRGDGQDYEGAAREVMARRGLSGEHLRYRDHRRFRDDPADEHYRLVRAFFAPVE